MFCLKWILSFSKKNENGEKYKKIDRYLKIIEAENTENFLNFSEKEKTLSRDIEALRNIRNLSFFHNNKGIAMGSYQPPKTHEIPNLKKSFKELVEFATSILSLCASTLISPAEYAGLKYSNCQDWVESLETLFRETNHGIFEHTDKDQRPAGFVKYEIAQNLLAENFDIKDVERWTGMPEFKIKFIREHLNVKCPAEN